MAVSEVQSASSAPILVLEKAQDQEKVEGQQAVSLIQGAGEVAKAASADPSIGTKISTVA